MKKILLLLLLLSNTSYANEYITGNIIINNTYISTEKIILYVFFISYLVVISEEFIKIKKSKVTILASSIIWVLVATIAINNDKQTLLTELIKHNLLEYAELFLFLFVTMIYINTIKERKTIKLLKYFFLKKNYTLKKIYWITGFASFIISPIADNLTTALIMSSILMSIENDKKFINLSCINIVVASNAGGSFSPFGDITTLMVWQKNIIEFELFLKLFIPAIVSFIIPSIIISFKIENKKPEKKYGNEKPELKFGAKIIPTLFLITILISIIMQNYFKIPAAIGMMTGLGLLQIVELISTNRKEKIYISEQIKKIEWETLLFFYGIMLCIGGIAAIGYLNDLSNYIYNELGKNLLQEYKQIPGNIIIGLLSAIVDNIPIMFSILTMNPTMNNGEWLLVTLTTGVGGSILSIGSAAGIALMGQTNGKYTFFSHLKWSWIILIGYFASIITHIYINNNLFI